VNTNSAFSERRSQDLQKLKLLAERSHPRLKLIRVSGDPPNEFDVEFRVRTAPSREYPRVVQEVTKVTISLPSRYPFDEPKVTIKTPILHPNVYASGLICLGTKWIPTNGLDLLVKRIGQIITFDPTILNDRSPANRDALAWYQGAKRQHSNAFPTDTWIVAPSEPEIKISWNNLPINPQKRVIPCPGCGTKLSLPAGKRGQAKCPRCNRVFEVAL
jgi:ubiquitin-protein ligase